MSLAPWRSPLSRALHRNRSLPNARYFQLATVRPNGQPANRTVVFRGFTPESDRLQTVTDTRSQKIHQIEHLTWGEICWYFPKTREQFRLNGSLLLIKPDDSNATAQEMRSRLWQVLSDNARSQFGWPCPGTPLLATSDFETSDFETSDFESQPLDPDSPPDTFCILVLEPVWVDHLELRGNPQNRYIYKRDAPDSWSVQAVHP
ncbi:MAG: Npun_F5749 family FMN-dependent PPOX-type flavoprotein [Elainellaceae cyanobacterium]